MQKAGGIIALIAGIFRILAAGITLLAGGFSSAVGAEEGATVIGLGWGGVFFPFLVIVFGAVTMGAKNKIPGVLLLASSVLGVIFGGTLVAIFMVLAAVGGIVALLGSRKQNDLAEA